MNQNDNFDLAVRSPGDTAVISIDSQRSRREDMKAMIEMQAAFISESTAMPKNTSQEEKARLALVGAILKVEYGLCVVAQEAYFIPIGKDKTDKSKKTFTVDVSYKGLTKKKREYEQKTGDRLFQGRGSYASPDEVERLYLHHCRKCGGSGRYTWDGKDQGPCNSCSGEGKFNPASVLLYEVEYNSKLDGLAAKQIGVDYIPMKGSALWQPSDNVAQNRTPEWMVEKNAYKDVIRRLVPVTDPGGRSEAFDMDQVEDKSTESIAALCVEYGVEYDDLHSLAGLVRNSVLAKWASKWKDEAEVIAALATLGIEWRMADEEKIKYQLFGYKLGEYPLDKTDVFDKEDGAISKGILAKNVIFEVGGLEKANEISQKLFQKNCSVGLTRAELKQIYESVVDGQS